jgi:glycosyltransferase involved in cell wall biosynthesis
MIEEQNAEKNGFSIIIPTYNRAELLRAALGSVQKLQVPENWGVEILVIDNNSTDHTKSVAEEAKQKGPLSVRHIVETNQGLNHGRNRGIREASFEYLVYLDDDMLVDLGWLEGYVEAQAKFSPDAVVGPVDPMFEEQPSDWMTPRMIKSVSSAYSQKGDQLILVPNEHAHELPGCNFAVLRSVAVAAGGFHPSLDRCGAGMLAGGDWEFGERLVLLGKRVAYSPKCRIRHLVSRHKISRDGLRARWEGGGATAGAKMLIRGKKLPVVERIHLTLRMMRLFMRSYRYQITGDDIAAFRWELEALNLRGLLFKTPCIKTNLNN